MFDCSLPDDTLLASDLGLLLDAIPLMLRSGLVQAVGMAGAI